MYPIGISTCGKQVNESLFRACAAAGAAFAELSPESDEYAGFDYAAAEAAARNAGVKLWSFHLQFMPFGEIDPSSLNEGVRRRTTALLGEQIRRAAAIGVDKFILHASAEPIPEGERAARMAQAEESVFALASVAAAAGGVLCVENLPRTCLGRNSAELKELLSVFPGVRACFDTNHLLSESHADFIAALGEKIVTLHVSDYDFIDEKHWLPGEGLVDWAALASALQGVGYNGVWMYELGFAPKRSMPRKRDLTPADLVRNAREIFAGSFPLTRVP